MSSHSLQFRLASEDDGEILGRLYGELSSCYSDLPVEFVPRERLARCCQHPGYAIWLACDDSGSVLGTYSLIIVPNPAHNAAGIAIVENVVVSPAARGHGVGRDMMDHAYQTAKEEACYKIMLSSNMARERAHAFYERLGYQLHGYSFAIDIQD